MRKRAAFSICALAVSRTLVLAFTLTLASALALAQPAVAATEPATTEQVLDQARQQFDSIQKSLEHDLTDERLVAVRDEAIGLQHKVEQLAVELTPELDNLQARVAELGPPPEGGEAPDVAAQRAALNERLSQLDAQVKLARLLGVEGTQAIERIQTLRRAGFQARLFEQSASVLAPSFWRELSDNAARDLGRVGTLANDLWASALTTSPVILVPLLLAAGAVVAVFVWGRGALLRFTATRVPAGRLRRSALATANTLMPTLACLVVVSLLTLGPGWDGPLSTIQATALAALIGATTFGTYTANLGYALLSPRRPSWRLPPLPNLLAVRLRRFPLLLGATVGLGFLAERIASLVNVTLATTVALNALIALVLGLVLVRALRRGREALLEVLSAAQGKGIAAKSETAPLGAAAPPSAPSSPPSPASPSSASSPSSSTRSSPAPSSSSPPSLAPPSPPPSLPPPLLPRRLALFGGAIWLLVALSLVAVVGGFVALGSFVIKQVAWITIVVCSVYLLGALIDDAATGLLASSPRSRSSAPSSSSGDGKRDRGADGFGVLGAQAAVLASGISRVCLVLVALVLIVAPFGEGPAELLSRAGSVGHGVTVGEIQVRPGLVLEALLVLLLGVVAVRLGQRWLAERFLPTTTIEPGMASSATSLLGFLGIVAVVALALSVVGLSLERVAWVASALSVGIGFGLQAVVSNFVAGLILLVERPVKVGDWVSLSGIEGDIRRINVRATEIQTGDRSTVIVPNSEFITKTVRNLTLANPLGLVSIKLPMPLDTDVERVREVLLASLNEYEDVLTTPAPSVHLESIDATSVVFSLSGSVSSPRRAYAVRSALLFDILGRLRGAGIAMARPVSAGEVTAPA